MGVCGSGDEYPFSACIGGLPRTFPMRLLRVLRYENWTALAAWNP
jgi:hypothetical protein